MDMGCRVGWFTVSKHDIMTSFVVNPIPNFPKFGPHLHVILTMKGCTHVPIHSIWRCSNTSYTSNVNVGYRVGGFIASRGGYKP